MSLGTICTTFNCDIIEQCSVTKEWDGFGKSQTMLMHFFFNGTAQSSSPLKFPWNYILILIFNNS